MIYYSFLPAGRIPGDQGGGKRGAVLKNCGKWDPGGIGALSPEEVFRQYVFLIQCVWQGGA